MVTFEQTLLSYWSNIGTAVMYSSPMSPNVRVGAILVKDWAGMPDLLGLECEPCSGPWTLLKALDVGALDRKIHAAGWNFFFMASEVKVMFLGSIGTAKLHHALKRILEKVEPQHFNGLEVTAIVTRHFLGIPYVTMSAHSRHMQHSCYLESAAARQTSQSSQNGPES